MSEIQKAGERYEELRQELERNHHGEWAVIHERELAGTYGTFEEASQAAAIRFGAGPYLIRQIGIAQPPLPVSVLWPTHA